MIFEMSVKIVLKPNYKNEDYKSSLLTLIILIVIILITVFPILFYNGMFDAIINGDISSLIFLIIFLSMAIIPGIFLFRDYKKEKHQRKINLHIIKNGVCVEGKILSIRHIYTPSELDGHSGHHNTIAEVEFIYNSSKKVIMVENLLIKEENTKKYENKKVKVYIYNNMHYVDIIN